MADNTNSLMWPADKSQAVLAILDAMQLGDALSSLQHIAGFPTAADYVAATQLTMVDHVAHQTGMYTGNATLLASILGNVYLRREKDQRIEVPIVNDEGEIVGTRIDVIPYDYAHEAAEQIVADVWEVAKFTYPSAPEMAHCSQCHITLERTDWAQHERQHQQ